MVPDIDCIVTGAGSDCKGEIRIWQTRSPDTVPHGIFKERQSLSAYAVAVSPTGRHLAAGFRNGLVRAWPFLGQGITENAPPILERYHQACPVNAVAFLTDDIIVSAGVNGKLRVLSIKKQRHLCDIEAHTGPIFSVIALGSKVAVSLGADGKLKLWDMDALTCEFQAEGFDFSAHAMPSLAFSRETGFLCCPSPDGRLHLFDMKNAAAHETFQAHQGTFYALTAFSGYLVTGGMDERKLKLWDLGSKQNLKSTDIGAAVFRLCHVGDKTVAAIATTSDKSQSLQFYSVPELLKMADIPGQSLRSVASIPLPAIDHRRNVALIRLRSDLVRRARERLMSPEQMAPFLEQLAQKGFMAEAKILQAESAKVRNKPLHELGFLQQLVNVINPGRDTVPAFLRLAVLLEELNEPDIAAQVYLRIQQFQNGIADVRDRLNRHPASGIDPEGTVRVDISAVDMLKQETEKNAALGRPFAWQVIIPQKAPKSFGVKALNTPKSWLDRLQSPRLLRDRKLHVKLENVTFFDGRNKKRTTWVKIAHISDIPSPSPFLSYALTLDGESSQAQGYGIFDPLSGSGLSESVIERNGEIARVYRALCSNPQTGRWLTAIHKAMKKIDAYAYVSSR